MEFRSYFKFKKCKLLVHSLHFYKVANILNIKFLKSFKSLPKTLEQKTLIRKLLLVNYL